MVSISTLRPGDEVRGVFACIRKDRLMTRTGAPYLVLELRDRTGTISARAFRDADVLAGRFERGDLVRVAGRVERFRDELVVEVSIDRPGRARRRRWRPGPVPAHGLPGPRRARRVPRAPGRRGPRSRLSLAARRAARRWRAARCVAPGAVQPRRAPRVSGRAARAHGRGGDAGLRGLPAASAAELRSAADGRDHPRPRAHARVHLRRRVRADRRGPAARPSGDRRADVVGARSGALDEGRRLALLHCVLSHHGPTAAPGGRFASAEALALYRCNALDASVKGAFEQGL